MKKRSKIITIITIIIATAIIIVIKMPSTKKEESNQDKQIKTIEQQIEYKPEDNQSTRTIPELTIEDEEKLEDQELEDEGFEMQGEIKYEEGESKNNKISIGNYSGLTYFSQIDSRWKDKKYTSTGNKNQTIGTSGCGPTSASIIVSSIKGTVTPDIMANAFVENGYRSANNGTYWSAFRWVADQFDIGYKESANENTAIDLIRNNNYMSIVSVGNGLFTTGGHFVVIYGIDKDTLKIYDPYLYTGKFETSTRRNKVTVSGNTVLCSIENFRNYANPKGFFLFKNTNQINENVTNSEVTNNQYTRYVNAKIGLNIRNLPNGTKVGTLANNTKVTVYETNGNWSKIEQGWVFSDYLVSKNSDLEVTKSNSYKYTLGTYKVNCSKLNVRTGPGTNYRIKKDYELTKNAIRQGGYVKDLKFSVLKINGNWGLTPSGWVYLLYCQKT